MEQSLDVLSVALSRSGFKLTQQRLSIYRALQESRFHPSCDDLFRMLRPSMPSLSMDTIYRTVGTLEQSGVVRKLVSMDGIQRYDANLAEHHHFVCEHCFGVWDIVWEEFSRIGIPSLSEWGSVHSFQVEFRGVCVACETMGGSSPVDQSPE
ncbi:MAG: Fur family transcriptional regulator [Leptospirales bacterium]